MTISNYGGLKSEMASWLHRNNMTDRIPTFIQLFEASINRTMRARFMESDNPLTLTATNRTIALPDGYLEPLQLSIDLPPRIYPEYKVPSQLPINITYSGLPKYWTINNTNIEFEIPADKNYTIQFKMLKSFALSDSAPTNWLLTNHPDVYLWGSLMQAAPWMRNTDDLTLWSSLYKVAHKELMDHAARSKIPARLATNLPRSSRGTFNINAGE